VADHQRLDVLKRFTALLEGITVADGYEHNMPGQVFRGRLVFGEEVAPPFISIMEAPRPDFAQFAGGNEVRKDDWSLLIQGWAKEDPENPLDALYPLLTDVEERLARVIAVDRYGDPLDADNYMLGRTIVSLQVSPPVVRPPSSDPVAKGCFLLTLRVGLATSAG
jgi:hypothetical protein